MAFNTFKVLDGYALNNGDGYSFVTPWIPIRNCFAFSISCTFGGSPSGTIQLNCSNEDSIACPPGPILNNATGGYVQGNQALAEQPRNNGLDSSICATVLANATSLTPATTHNVSSAGVVTFDEHFRGFHWVQVEYIASSGTGTVDIWFNGKW